MAGVAVVGGADGRGAITGRADHAADRVGRHARLVAQRDHHRLTVRELSQAAGERGRLALLPAGADDRVGTVEVHPWTRSPQRREPSTTTTRPIGAVRDGCAANARAAERRRARRAASCAPKRVDPPAASRRGYPIPRLRRDQCTHLMDPARGLRQPAAVAAVPYSHHLGHDRKRGLLRAHGTQVEPDRGGDALQELLADARGQEPLTAVRLGAPAAHRAHIGGVGAQRDRERRVVQLRVVGEDGDVGGAVDPAEPGKGLFGPRRDLPPPRRGSARRVANWERGSHTNGRQPAARASRASEGRRSPRRRRSRAWARVRRRRRTTCCRRPRASPSARPRAAPPRPRRPRASSSAAPSPPSVLPSARTSSFAPMRRPVDHGNQRRAAVRGSDVRELGLEAHRANSSTKTSISPPHGSPTSQASLSAIPKWRRRGSCRAQHLGGGLDHGALDAAAGDRPRHLAALVHGHLRAGRARRRALHAHHGRDGDPVTPVEPGRARRRAHPSSETTFH